MVVGADATLGVLDVAFTGAVRAPWFVRGQTNNTEWRDTIRWGGQGGVWGGWVCISTS